ncbi:GT-D fold domain-containing glycosyltransferase [Chryseobacterium sp. MDT2-18]|uniref:GT-D fold domain-containing glycosyltransferase n=1 Tax=Chryseobacterium sp. MDT2-18 TaxID=1259136 RepID=UPI0027D7B65A|nr:GT-D fold domain-containing glycosyltransferase [Chryseobacterium sp. MDT2-18]
MTIAETIADITDNKKSISRLGDGEFKLLLKAGDIGFQKQDLELSNKILEVIYNRNPKFLIALPDSIATTKTHKRFAKVYWIMFINNHGKALSKILDKNYRYGNANMTRLYAGMRNQSKSKEYFDKVRTIWENKDIVIIEGNLSRLGVGNDLFDNVKTLQRIICPHKNAYEKYEHIKKAATKYGADKLIVVALGPTATVLCSELCNDGFWAVDIGHIDVEYMWMLMGTTQRTAIKGRHVNESNNSEGYELDPELIGPYRKSIILDLSN